MFHISAFHRPNAFSDPFSSRGFRLHPLIAAAFLLGIVSGCVIGLFSDPPQSLPLFSSLIASDTVSSSFSEALWHSSRFILIALLFAAGIPGLALIPLLSAFRGFAFACCIASLMPTSIRDCFLSFLSFGVPALFEIPAFLIAETDGFAFSLRLISRQKLPSGLLIPLMRRLLCIPAVCFADAAYICFVLPRLLLRLS